ncbi:hypothetical protein SBD_5488 [Streptomyces bottropensis ATCC 25435]|uniref:Uncharacterized protein n=1 Tax=Streptomyces bottropensis ATCC 25435 TaxID=1054862 RepID=M3D844_9ACTN|nr:hypothetical protein SBD_5488 [Streptomyces bottropensis ATCC 25435]
MISTGNGHAYAKPSGVSSARARQLRDSHTTASMRSATARESTRHTARSVMAPGNGAMGSNDLPPYAPATPQGKPSGYPQVRARRFRAEVRADVKRRQKSHRTACVGRLVQHAVLPAQHARGGATPRRPPPAPAPAP